MNGSTASAAPVASTTPSAPVTLTTTTTTSTSLNRRKSNWCFLDSVTALRFFRIDRAQVMVNAFMIFFLRNEVAVNVSDVLLSSHSQTLKSVQNLNKTRLFYIKTFLCQNCLVYDLWQNSVPISAFSRFRRSRLQTFTVPVFRQMVRISDKYYICK